MGVDGTIVTPLKSDNRALPLACVVVRDGRGYGGQHVIIDVDSLLLNRDIGGLGSMSENPVALFKKNSSRSRPAQLSSLAVSSRNDPAESTC